MYLLGDIVRKHARMSKDVVALVDGDKRFTYRELDQNANRLANGLLGLGLKPGDRVAILAENAFKYIDFFFAASKAGLVSVPLNFRLTPRELQYMISDSGARVVLVGGGYTGLVPELAKGARDVQTWIALDDQVAGLQSYDAMVAGAADTDPCLEIDENQLAMLLYTGGTTGLPKGVMLSHRNLMTAFSSIVIQFGFGSDDTTCMALPMFHAALWQVFTHFMVGGRVVVLPRPELTDIMRSIETEKCTTINAVPTLYNWLIAHPDIDTFDLSSLRLMVYGGSPFPEEILRKCIARFGPVFAQGYGLTEAAPTVCFLNPEDHALEGPKSRLLTSAGKEMFYTEVRVVDPEGVPVAANTPGEIVARGANIMLGYWNNAALTRERLVEGWLHTGDIGLMDDEGYVFLLDRKSDMIVSGGENVYPSEVEGILYQHPDIQECVVTSAPDPQWGECVVAVIVTKSGARIETEQVIAFSHENLAGYKCPKRVEIWAELPKTPVGKLLRRDVKDSFWQGHDRNVG